MSAISQAVNVKEVVPFLQVQDLQQSLHFYREGLHFDLRHRWPGDQDIKWCWLTIGGASIMLQTSNRPNAQGDEGRLSLCFMCEDALQIYDEGLARGLAPLEPYVGNALWVVSFFDPDGNRIEFESPTNVAEGTKLSEYRPN